MTFIIDVRLFSYFHKCNNDTDRKKRKCKFCKEKVEDEYHFLLICPKYLDIRKQYMPEKVFLHPNLHKFNLLMSAKSESLSLYLLCL